MPGIIFWGVRGKTACSVHSSAPDCEPQNAGERKHTQDDGMRAPSGLITGERNESLLLDGAKCPTFTKSAI